jgi:hypothetical protein
VTVDEYRAAIRTMGLTPVRPSTGKHTLHRWRDGQLYPIRDPDLLSNDARAAAIDFYRVTFDRPAS